MAFEMYNTLVCVIFPEYRTAAFVGHHLVTLVLSVLSSAPFVHFCESPNQRQHAPHGSHAGHARARPEHADTRAR